MYHNLFCYRCDYIDVRIKRKENMEELLLKIKYSMTLDEIGDKVSEDEKAPVRAAVDKLKETVKSGTTDAIKADTEALQQAFYKISEKLYGQSGAQGAQGADGAPGNGSGAQGAGSDGTYYNADFEDKTDNK